MNRKRRNLLLLLAATLVLGGLLWLVLRTEPAVEEEPDHTHEHTVSDSDSLQTGLLFDLAQEDIQKIVFRNENASYTVRVDKEKGEVVFDELKGLPTNDFFMEYVWYGVAGMTYSDIVAETDAEGYRAKTYGLDKPSLTVTAYAKDGQKITFRAGSEVPGGEDGVYYTLVEGDNHVYACPIDVPFFMGDSYYLNDDVFYAYDEGIDSSKITIGDITLEGSAFQGAFVMKENMESNPTSPFYGYDYTVTSPIHWPVGKTASTKLVYDLTYLMADEMVQRNPSRKDIKKYGLDKPTLTVRFTRNGKECVLLCRKADKEKLYLMLEGGKMIYQVQADSLSILSELSPEKLYSLNEIGVSLETVSAVTVKSDKVSAALTVSRTENPYTMAETDAIYTYTAQANGKDIPYATYTGFMKQLNNSVISRWNVKKPKGKPAVTVTVAYFENDGRKADTVSFYRYNDREYAAVWEGRPVNTVTATWLNALLESAGQF